MLQRACPYSITCAFELTYSTTLFIVFTLDKKIDNKYKDQRAIFGNTGAPERHPGIHQLKCRGKTKKRGLIHAIIISIRTPFTYYM
jgi:hypothetical protein